MKAEDFDNVFKPHDKNIIEAEVETPKANTDNLDLVMIREVMDRMMSKDDIGMKTEFGSDKEVMLVARVKIMAEYFDIDILRQFLNELFLFKLSRKRKSREEMVEIISKITTKNPMEKELAGKLVGESW